LVRLHNAAPEEPVYGEGLYTKMQSMFSKDEVEKLFVLSLEWPN
jgi:hypothetical protein